MTDKLDKATLRRLRDFLTHDKLSPDDQIDACVRWIDEKLTPTAEDIKKVVADVLDKPHDWSFDTKLVVKTDLLAAIDAMWPEGAK